MDPSRGRNAGNDGPNFFYIPGVGFRRSRVVIRLPGVAAADRRSAASGILPFSWRPDASCRQAAHREASGKSFSSIARWQARRRGSIDGAEPMSLSAPRGRVIVAVLVCPPASGSTSSTSEVHPYCIPGPAVVQVFWVKVPCQNAAPLAEEPPRIVHDCIVLWGKRGLHRTWLNCRGNWPRRQLQVHHPRLMKDL